MPLNRPNLTLDEQSFQDLLSAAFTIQAHNDQVKQARLTETEPEASSVCRHCGAPKPTEGAQCESCGLDEYRPGERLQRNWASMWLMSQEQGLWPERSPENGEGTQKETAALEVKGRLRAQTANNFPGNGVLAVPVVREGAEEAAGQEKTGSLHDRVRGNSLLSESDEGTKELTSEDFASEDSELTVHPFHSSASDDSFPTDASTDTATDAGDGASASLVPRFRAWHVTLRFHRADLYLGAAIFVAAMALLWPAAGTPRRAALGPFERALVTLGIAEVPAPVVHFQGDPGITVWVDPHSALYYCPGEEQYGTTANGRFSNQREAQMDRFEPAGRSACE
jgi:ribosomal protein L40E